MARNIIVGQRIQGAKIARAKELRRNPTPAERLLWAHLRRNQLGGYHFRRQQVISGFIVDFYCHRAAVAIEIDGAVHRRQHEYDLARDTLLFARGVRVLRFSNDHVTNDISRVIERIGDVLAGT